MAGIVNKVYYLVPFTGADPGFFVGGGALVSCPTSTPINQFFFFAEYQLSVVLENHRSSQGEGGLRTPCTLPLDPPLLYPCIEHSICRVMRKISNKFH